MSSFCKQPQGRGNPAYGTALNILTFSHRDVNRRVTHKHGSQTRARVTIRRAAYLRNHPGHHNGALLVKHFGQNLQTGQDFVHFPEEGLEGRESERKRI